MYTDKIFLGPTPYGVDGNETVDLLAKQALSSGDVDVVVSMSKANAKSLIWTVMVQTTQFAYCPNRSTDNAISIALHTALSHLDKRNTYVRMLFID